MKLTYIKIFAIVLILVFAANISYSGPRKKVGTSAAPELLIPVGSVGTSLSGANLSTVSGVDAIYWNPAGLANIDNKYAQVIFSHSTYIADMKLEYLAAGAKLGSLGNIGVSIKTLNIGEIQETSELQPEGTGNTIKPTYVIGNLGFARSMTDRIKFGANVKIISEDVANVSATGFAFDFGIQYIGGQSGFSFGIALKNLGPSMTFNGPGLDRSVTLTNGNTYTERVILQDYDLPTSLEIGLGYNFRLTDKMNLNLFGAFSNQSFTRDEFKFGLEYNFNKMFYVRGAASVTTDDYEQGSDYLFGPTFGAGIKYPFGNLEVGFDYAYRVINESGFDATNQFFTLHLGF